MIQTESAHKPAARSYIEHLLMEHSGAIVQQWHAAILPTSFSPLPTTAVRYHLAELSARLIVLLLMPEPDLAAAEEVGVALVELHYVQPASLRTTLDVLSRQMLTAMPDADAQALQPRLLLLMNALAIGFHTAARERMLIEQDEIRRALLMERLQTENALRASEATTRALVEAIPDLILRVRRDGICLDYQAGHALMLDVQPAAIIGQPLTQLWSPIVSRDISFYIERAIQSHTTQMLEFHHTQGHTTRDYEARVVESGVDEALILVRDITERNRALALRRAHEAQLRAIFEGATIGMALTNAEGWFIDTNPAFQQMLHSSAAELLQRRLSDITHPEDADANQQLYQDLVTGKHAAYQVESRYLRKNGEIRFGQLNVSLLNQDNLGTRYGLCMIEDITERKQAEAALIHLHKLESLEVLAGGIAHEFNNILIIILGNLELTRLDLPPDLPVLSYISQIEAVAQRAAELTKQMLIYAGQGAVDVQLVDLSQLVAQIGEVMAILAPKQAQVEYALMPALSLVVADATKLRQTIVSLIANAVDALDGGSGRIEITTGQLLVDASYRDTAQLTYELAPGSYVYVEVADTGHGMDADIYTKMFDPFFTTKANGCGLSLAAVRGVVRSHQGAIQVWSSLGSGTTIRVLLPREVEQPPAP